MTPEQEASDLVRDIIGRAKQNKAFKRPLTKLQKLAKKDQKAKVIYDILINSVGDKLEIK